MGKSEIEAKPLVVQQRQESLLDRQDVYIRVFFSILRNGGRGGSKMDNEYAVAESIDLHHIYGTNDQSFDENCIIQTTLIYDCNDLLIDDSGQCNDPEGEFGIIMNALNEVENFVLGLKDRMPKANIYLYIYGFEQVDEIVRSFSYLVDSDNSLGVGFVNEELLSNVMQVTPLSDYYLKTGYLFYVNYVGEYQYYQVYQPLIGGVEINVEPIKPTKISNSTLSMSISDYSSARQDTRTLYGHVEKTDIDILNTTQLVLDVASIMPVIGEVSSLVNGFIYLGREFNAGMQGDFDKMNQFKEDAIKSFIGAIPGSSLAKGAVKVYRAGRAVNKVRKAEKVLVNADKALNSTSKAIEAANRSKKSGAEFARLHQLSPRQAQAKVFAKQKYKEARRISDDRLRETGMTIGESLDISAEALRRPNFYLKFGQNTFKTTGKIDFLPRTRYDNIIDGVDYINKVFREAPEKADEINKTIDDYFNGE